jgi:hypothetical protein
MRVLSDIRKECVCSPSPHSVLSHGIFICVLPYFDLLRSRKDIPTIYFKANVAFTCAVIETV